MRKFFKALAVLLLLSIVSCQNPKTLEIKNISQTTMYLMDPDTAKGITPEQLKDYTKKETLIYLQPGSSYAHEGSSFGISDTFINKYLVNGEFTICYVTEKELNNAEKENRKIKYETFSSELDMKKTTLVVLDISEENGKLKFDLQMN